jgi:hypothetical protein
MTKACATGRATDGREETSGRTTRVEIVGHALEQRGRERRPERVADADLLLKVLVQTFTLSCHLGSHGGSARTPALSGVERLDLLTACSPNRMLLRLTARICRMARIEEKNY